MRVLCVARISFPGHWPGASGRGYRLWPADGLDPPGGWRAKSGTMGANRQLLSPGRFCGDRSKVKTNLYRVNGSEKIGGPAHFIIRRSDAL